MKNDDLEAALRRADQKPSEADHVRLRQAILARAEGDGLVDVAYAEMDSPLGKLLLASTPGGLVRISYEDFGGPGWKPVNARDTVLESLARQVSPRILEAPGRLDGVRRQLDEYFAGRRRDFDLALDWQLIRGFTRGVLEATARIPFGEVSTYSEVAGAAGNPRASRAAGNALGANPIPIVIPCHRVLRAGHTIGGYTGGLEKKEHLLKLEGVLLT